MTDELDTQPERRLEAPADGAPIAEAHAPRLAALCASLAALLVILAGCGSGTVVSFAPSAMPTPATPSAEPTFVLVTATPSATPTFVLPTPTIVVTAQFGIPLKVYGFTLTLTTAAMGDRAEGLVDGGSAGSFAEVSGGNWTYTPSGWMDGALPSDQTLLAVHASMEAKATRYNAILYPTVADVTGTTRYPTRAVVTSTSPGGMTWLFAVPKLSLFSGVYSMLFSSGEIVILGRVA